MTLKKTSKYHLYIIDEETNRGSEKPGKFPKFHSLWAGKEGTLKADSLEPILSPVQYTVPYIIQWLYLLGKIPKSLRNKYINSSKSSA